MKKIVGSQNQRELKKLRIVVDSIVEYESSLIEISTKQLIEKTNIFKEKIKNTKDSALDTDENEYYSQIDSVLLDILPEAFAVIREASKRALGLRPFDVQLIGGIPLHQGKIAEMKTGEGKTLVAALPLYLNGLTGNGAHLITANASGSISRSTESI